MVLQFINFIRRYELIYHMPIIYDKFLLKQLTSLNLNLTFIGICRTQTQI